MAGRTFEHVAFNTTAYSIIDILPRLKTRESNDFSRGRRSTG